MEHDKSRHAPAVEKFHVQMTDDQAAGSIRFTYLGPAPEAAVKGAEARAFVLGVLEDVGECRAKELSARAEAQGLNFRTVQRALVSLIEEKSVVRLDRGRYASAASQTGLEV